MISTVGSLTLGFVIGWLIADVIRLRRDIRGLALRVADLDRDLLALEASLTGDGK